MGAVPSGSFADGAITVDLDTIEAGREAVAAGFGVIVGRDAVAASPVQNTADLACTGERSVVVLHSHSNRFDAAASLDPVVPDPKLVADDDSARTAYHAPVVVDVVKNDTSNRGVRATATVTQSAPTALARRRRRRPGHPGRAAPVVLGTIGVVFARSQRPGWQAR